MRAPAEGCREAWRDGTLVLTVCVHAQPGARRTQIAGLHGPAVKIRIASPAVEGRANAELVRFVADEFGVPVRQVAIVRGDTGREKVLSITAPVKRPDREWFAPLRHSPAERNR